MTSSVLSILLLIHVVIPDIVWILPQICNIVRDCVVVKESFIVNTVLKSQLCLEKLK